MADENPVSDLWAKRIRAMWNWQRDFRGDNVRQTSTSVFVGSPPEQQPPPPNSNWQPRQFRVKSEENDYLVCVPYDSQDEVAGEKEYKIAKSPEKRSIAADAESEEPDTVKGVFPAYVPNQTVIWAAPFRRNGADDGLTSTSEDVSQITLMEVGVEGRTSAVFWARIDGYEVNSTGQYRYAWSEYERASSGWQSLTDGRMGTAAEDGEYATNSLEGTLANVTFGSPSLRPAPIGSYVRMYAEPLSTGTVYSFEFAPFEVGFGKPVGSASDLPVSSTIELTITDASGAAILNSSGAEETITVWRNTSRKSLYLDFISSDVFFYVKFSPNESGVDGCIFSRTEGMEVDDTYLPSGGIAISGSTAPSATDATGNAGNSDHVYVTGNFYYEKSGGTHGGWKPWFALDPSQLGADGKVFTDAADTTKGFLDDEIIVDPGGGADFWISKTVDPGGAADNKLLLEHKDQQAAIVSLTPMTSLTEPADGTVRINSASVPVDDKGHVVDASSVSNTHDIIFTSTDGSVGISTSIAAGDVTVDLGSPSAGSGGGGIRKTFWVVVEDGASTATITLDSTNDWRGRTILGGSILRYDGTVASALTATTWSNQTSLSGILIMGANRATEYSIAFGSGYELKVSATGDLQFTGVDAGAADQNWYITIHVSDRLTTNTHTIS